MFFMLTGVDPVKVTEYSIVLSAAALPLTYFPILVIANDPDYMHDRVNGKALNVVAMLYLVILCVVAAFATHPAHDHHQGGGMISGTPSARLVGSGPT